jgi:hypothetical protein
MTEDTFPVPLLGDSSYQVFFINKAEHGEAVEDGYG